MNRTYAYSYCAACKRRLDAESKSRRQVQPPAQKHQKHTSTSKRAISPERAAELEALFRQMVEQIEANS